MKKAGPYCLLSMIFWILSIVLSALFNFSLTNTWQALVSLLLIAGPLWVYGWKQINAHKGKYPLLCYYGRFCLILFAVGYFITVIAFVVGLV